MRKTRVSLREINEIVVHPSFRASGTRAPGFGLRKWARRLKREIHTLLLVAKHPALPWYVRLLAGLVLAYAFSPIDLIPDFIPVLGYLDDLILLPLGIALCIRLTPPEILTECRIRVETIAADGGEAGDAKGTKRRSRLGMWLVIGVWIGLCIIILWSVGFAVFR
jgi:uncharacterized membrane protein YkvA (DUF1232 family)